MSYLFDYVNFELNGVFFQITVAVFRGLKFFKRAIIQNS